MSTGSVRSPPPGGAVESTSVTCYFLPMTGERCLAVAARGDPAAAIPPARPARALDVEEPHVLGVALDERPPCLHVLPHQDAEQLVRLRGVVERDLEQHAVRGVHRGFPQFGGVHLAKALEPLHSIARPRVLAPGRDARLD